MGLYRKLTEVEISQLTSQNCNAEDWSLIDVDIDFDVRTISNTSFSGTIKLGKFESNITEKDGFSRHSGIRNARIHNCEIGNNVLIENIADHIANYHILDDAIIRNTNLLTVIGSSSFGNGVKVAAINEGGGREVVIYNELSSQIAYLQAVCRDYPQMVEKLQDLCSHYYEPKTFGEIGRGVKIINCGTLINVNIGANAQLEGSKALSNGSIISNAAAPTLIGNDVIAKDFIVSSGCEITDGALLDRCFVGQACQIGKQFSATDVLFFCNCQAFHGEAASLFAGPFTVTHHKSTLLIAGMFSFFNAGSGTNQSNHMYRLGPNHQGLMERGAKAGSGSYILWPAQIGAFSLVKGRHYHHPNTSILPFSYLLESNGETIVVPGANIKSVGTIRDAQKWPKRDNRKGDLLDNVSYSLLNPYIIGKMMDGLDFLNKVLKDNNTQAKGFVMKESSIKHGIEYYTQAIWLYIGNEITKQTENRAIQINDIFKNADYQSNDIQEWMDFGGAICPTEWVNELIREICENTFANISDVNQHIKEMFLNTKCGEWNFVCLILEKMLNKPVKEIQTEDLLLIMKKWEAATSLLYKVSDDAKKEFDEDMQISYGSFHNDRTNDFKNVQGTFEDTAFCNADQFPGTNLQKTMQLIQSLKDL